MQTTGFHVLDKEKYRSKTRTADQAIQGIKSGNKVFIGSGCAEHQLLVKSLTESGQKLADAEIIHVLTLGVTPHTELKLTKNLSHRAYCAKL